MRKQSMITKIDAERPKDVDAHHQKNDPGPAEEPGYECETRDEMDENDWSCVSRFDPPRAALCHIRRGDGVDYKLIVHVRLQPLDEASYRHKRVL
jgi:hypothetical protein